MNSSAADKPKQCLVIMGFGIKTDLATGRKLNLDRSYNQLIKPVVESKGLFCFRSDELKYSGSVDVPLYNQLLTADLVVADLSTANPNVFYELGIRHALRPYSTIVIAEDQLVYPFNVSHITINKYTHLGDGIDYVEMLRFQKILSETIDAVLESLQVDSPVYNFIDGLTPPSVHTGTIHIFSNMGDAVSTDKLVPEENTGDTQSIMVQHGEDALKKSQFSLSKGYFHSALQIAKSNTEGIVDSNSTYLIHRLAYTTYKAKEPNEIVALRDAIDLLNDLNPKGTNDAETVGLAGRIEKRLYLVKEGEGHLTNAIRYYERAYILLQNRYYGINLAYLINNRVHSNLYSNDQEKIADMILANRIRKEVLELCETDWLKLQSRNMAEREVTGRDEVLAIEQKEMENEMKFWIQVNKAEAYFGLGDMDAYREARTQAAAAEHDQSMMVGFEEHLEKLRYLLKKRGYLLTPAWSDEEAEVDLGSYDKMYTGALLELKQGNYQKALKFINLVIELDDAKTLDDTAYFPHPQLYEVKARILTALGDTPGAKAALDRYEELNDENRFRVNLSKEILLERLVIENIPFFGSFTWNFTPGINILLGKNGYGKSHLLRLLSALLYHDRQKIRDWIPANTPINTKAKLYLHSDHAVNKTEIDRLMAEMDQLLKQPKSVTLDGKLEDTKEKIEAEQRRILANKEGFTSIIGKVPLLAIPDSRFINRSESVVSNSKAAADDLKRDGATDFLLSTPFGPIISKGLYIVAQKNPADFSKEPYSLIQRVISELAFQRTAVADPVSGVPADKPFFKFTRIESTSTTGDYKIYVQAEEKNDEVLLNNISQGTFSVLAICLMIYRFLSELHPASANPLKETAIIIIDEIDAHLHPSWEQKIIGILRREFPKVQFIITAHTPLIVAGCLEKEVSVIRHNPAGFVLEQSLENFIGYSTPELFQKVFEIEDKDDQYLFYSSIASQESEIKSKIEQLEKSKKEKVFSPVQLNELNDLYKELNYINRVKEVQAKQVAYSTLETQNIILQQKILMLENITP